MPNLVDTVHPSTSGSRSRCTPSRDTSAPCTLDPPRATLSISSMNTIPFCSIFSIERVFRSSSLTSFMASSSVKSFIASCTGILRVLVRPPWPRLANMPCSCWLISSMPGGAMISTPAGFMFTSISISLSSRSPSRNFLRNFCRVEFSSEDSGVAVSPNPPRAGGSRTSRTRSSAASSARFFTRCISRSRVSFSATSARSRMIDSTSRPT